MRILSRKLRTRPSRDVGLRSQGHDVKVWPRYFQGMGRGNAVEANDTSPVHDGATDPRADGEAVPEQMPF
jgi:gamma-glutamyltranspeptidase/glutathione hydrolase